MPDLLPRELAPPPGAGYNGPSLASTLFRRRSGPAGVVRPSHSSLLPTSGRAGRLKPLIGGAIPLALLMVGAASAQEADPSPEAELRAFEIHPEIRVELFAAEPMVVNPIQMAFDARGRLWVICSYAYPQLTPGAEPNDELIILEDTDGDGRADRRTVFADGLLVPTGFELGDGGAYVANPPELLHFSDRDGDGRADERRVVLSGFGTEDNHHAISAWRWGPGGHLYFQSGVFLHTQVETPRGVVRLNDGGVFQFRPRSLELSIFARCYEFLNPWGHAFDRWGQNFLTEAPAGHIYYLTPGSANAEAPEPYPRIPGAPKSCGIEFVSGRAWPEAWQGDLILNAFKNKVVHRYKLSDDGSGFAARELEPLIVSHESSFRPVDVKQGLDGALYVADWYNPIIGHMQYNFRDPRRDKVRGRIWRVSHKARPLLKPPAIVGRPAAEILDGLKVPEDAHRHQVRRTLYEMDARDVVPALRAWLTALDPADPDIEHHLLEALWTFETIDVVEPELLNRLLTAKDGRARAAAARVLKDWRDRLPEPLQAFDELVGDDHPRARLEAVLGLSFIASPRSIELATRVLERPMDRYLDYALRLTAEALKPDWLPALETGGLDLGGDPRRLGFLLQLIHTRGGLAPLLAILRAPTMTAAAREQAMALVATIDQPEEVSALFDPLTYAAGPGGEPVETLRRWRLAGPVAVEPAERPEPAALQWREVEADGQGVVNLARLYGPIENRVVMAAAEIASATAQEALLGIHSDDGVEVHLNGQRIHVHTAPRVLNVEPDLIRARLAAGDNQLLLHVHNAGGDWAFKATILAETERYEPTLQARMYELLAEAARARGVRPTGDLEAVAADWDHPDPRLAAAAVRLAGAWRLEAFRPRLAAVAADAEAPLGKREAAAAALADLGAAESFDALRRLAAGDGPSSLRVAAVTALAGTDAAAAAAEAARLLTDPAVERSARGTELGPVFDAFLARAGGAEALAAVLEAPSRSGALSPDLSRIGLRQLYASGREAPRLARLLTAAAGLEAGPRLANGEEVEALSRQVERDGDAARGEAIFRREELSCFKCHAIAGAGGQVGPDLAGLGASALTDYLVTSVLQPSLAIREGYDAVAVTTRSGDFFHGVKLRATDHALFLRDALRDEIIVPLAEITEQRPTGSLMPEGLTDLLTRAELIDLIRFLAELGRPGPYATPNVPVLRRWRRLEGNGEPLDRRIVPGEPLPPPEGIGRWAPVYSQVSGDLPTEAMAERPDRALACVQAEIEVTTPGRIQLDLNSTRGLSLWIDGAPVRLGDSTAIDLDRGRHRLTFGIDRAARGEEGLRLEVREASGSAARVLPVAGR